MMVVEKHQGGFSPRIGQWERFQIIPSDYLPGVESFYSENYFSVIVRDFLASWIEDHPWKSIVEEKSANCSLNEMIQEIGKCAAEQRISTKLLLEKSAVMIKEHYERRPLVFVNFMKKMLDWELKYLELFEEKVENDAGGQSIETFNQTHYLEQLENSSKDILKKIKEVKNMISYPVGSHAGMPEKKKLQVEQGKDLNTVKDEHMKEKSYGILQEQLRRLKSMCQDLKCVMHNILDKNLQEWMRNQRMFEDSLKKDDIDQIQIWFSKIASLITDSLQQIKEISQIEQPMIYLLQTQINQLDGSFIDLRKVLLERSLIIRQQPPRIMMKNNDMEASVTLLCGLPSGCKSPTVTAQLISPTDRKDKGKLMNYTCSIQGQDTATFKKMKLTDVERSKQRNQSITEEKFILKFSVKINTDDIELPLEVFSLPVVVLTNVSQKIQATATILWDNYFADHIPDGENEIPEKVHWPQFADFLNYIFSKDIQVPLKPEHFKYFATKIFGEPVHDLSTKYVTWNQFAKKKIMTEKQFTFWDWFQAIGNLIKTQFLELYQADLIMGFVERDQSKRILLEKPAGTILLRFSDHTLGGITAAIKGAEKVSDLEPFTCKKLKKQPLADTMVHIFKKEYFKLYPDKPVKETFKKYIRKKQDTAGRLDEFGYVRCETTINVSFGSNYPEDEQEEYQSIQNNNNNPADVQEEYQSIQNYNNNTKDVQEEYQSIQNNTNNPADVQEEYQSIQNYNNNTEDVQEEYQSIQNNINIENMDVDFFSFPNSFESIPDSVPENTFVDQFFVN